MNSQKSKSRADLIILLLLPAPLTGILLILVAFYAITASEGISLDSEDSENAPVVQPTATLSSQAAIIATVNAAPPRQAAPPDVTSGSALEVATALGYDPALVASGQEDYLAVCSACHNIDAHGIAGLGKTLIGSEFINSSIDEDLLQFVVIGRPPWDPMNSTGIAMPPRGGNPGLTDDDLRGIIAYIRVLNSSAPTEVASTTQTESTGDVVNEDTASADIDESTPIGVSELLASSGIEPGGASGAASARPGADLYDQYCPAALTVCQYVAEHIGTDDVAAIYDMLLNGMPGYAAGNTTGINFIPGVGYPPMSAAEVINFMQYIADQEGVEFTPDAGPTPGEQFVYPDVSALLASLGIELPEPEPRP